MCYNAYIIIQCQLVKKKQMKNPSKCKYCKNSECQKFIKECYESWKNTDTGICCNGTLSEMQTCNWLSKEEKQ